MSASIDRRRFLGQTALCGTALTVAGSTVSAAGANEKVVVGVMGLERGRALAIAFARQPHVEVRYVCDVDSNRAAAAATSVSRVGRQSPNSIGDFRRILDDNEVDALVCAAPNHWHSPATILSCAAGKHVYVEKPCSHNPREGELMVRAARKHKRAVQMGTQRRSSKGIIEAIELVREGAIGRVYCSRAWYSSARRSIGKGKQAPVPSRLDYDLWQGPAPRVGYVDNRVHYNWHWFWHWGNGELGNNGVHTLDLCRWGLGVDYPIRVTSSGGRYVFDDDQQTADTHDVCFEFEGKKQISWQGISCTGHRAGFVDFYGEKGTISLTSGGTYTHYDLHDKVIKKTVSDTDLGEAEHITNFLTAIRDEQPLRLNSEIEIGHKSTLLCHLGNIAHRTGRTLNCSPNNGHILGDEKSMAFWSRDYEPGWEPRV